MGRNGAGKTTTLRSIMGLMPQGDAAACASTGQELLQLPRACALPSGLAYVPEERRIVPGLTVRENLQLGLVAARAARSMSAWRSTRSPRSFRA